MLSEGFFASLKKVWKDMDKPLLIATFLLVVIGALSIVCASSRETISRYDYSAYHFFFKQTLMILIAIVASSFILLVPTKYYHKLAKILWWIIMILLLVLLFTGDKDRGSINWIELGGFKFQPSEFAKPILIAALAILFEETCRKGNNRKDPYSLNFFFKWFACGILMPIIVFIQGDLGTCLILLGISIVMFCSSPINTKNKIRIIGILLCLLIIGILGIFLVRGYLFTKEQYSRFNFFNPCARYEDDGYQVCNGMIAINNGGFFGLGISKSQQKYSYIPDPHTDSIFAIIVEETGFLFGSIIILIYMWMMFRIYRICRKSNTIRGRYLAFGALIYLVIHVILNLGGILGILPLTGVPLPLLSYGGSFTISFLCMISIVQLVHIETKNKLIRLSDKM